MVKKIDIYTDGACSGNPGIGGWGAVLIYNKTEKKISGAKKLTTNNQMELKSVIESLKALKEECEVNIYTDSKYVKNGITEWIKNWEKNGWKTANKKPVKNKELWLELLSEISKHKISWHWVKGHAGNKYNEIADELAVNEVENLKNKN